MLFQGSRRHRHNRGLPWDKSKEHLLSQLHDAALDARATGATAATYLKMLGTMRVDSDGGYYTSPQFPWLGGDAHAVVRVADGEALCVCLVRHTRK